MEPWCNHDEDAIGDDGWCECGFDALGRRVEAAMRALVDTGDATPMAQRIMQRVLIDHFWPGFFNGEDSRAGGV